MVRNVDPFGRDTSSSKDLDHAEAFEVRLEKTLADIVEVARDFHQAPEEVSLYLDELLATGQLEDVHLERVSRLLSRDFGPLWARRVLRLDEGPSAAEIAADIRRDASWAFERLAQPKKINPDSMKAVSPKPRAPAEANFRRVQDRVDRPKGVMGSGSALQLKVSEEAGEAQAGDSYEKRTDSGRSTGSPRTAGNETRSPGA